jgi:hypothetical protein
MKITSTRLILDDAQLVGLVPDYTVSGPSGLHSGSRRRTGAHHNCHRRTARLDVESLLQPQCSMGMVCPMHGIHISQII